MDNDDHHNRTRAAQQHAQLRREMNMSAAPNLDQEFVLVVTDYNGMLYFPETSLADATFEQAIKDIRNGQYEGAVAVIQFNPVEKSCRDVTEDVMHAARFPTEEEAERDAFISWRDQPYEAA